jgi:Cytochrome C oxidase, cbb3-type, subunit III
MCRVRCRAACNVGGDDVADGHRYFVRYCASCHGTDGLGDGPVAKSLATPPANLRKLGDKYGMPLAAHSIAELIDGRDTARAHGSHEMPVWREKLYELGQGEKGEAGISERPMLAWLTRILLALRSGLEARVSREAEILALPKGHRLDSR